MLKNNQKLIFNDKCRNDIILELDKTLIYNSLILIFVLTPVRPSGNKLRKNRYEN